MTSQFSVLLRQLRRQAAMTQEDMAERAGVSVRTIRRLETGESANPQVETVRLLADALGLEADERARLLAVVDGQHPSERSNGRPGSGVERRLAEAADDLAQAVGARWRREEELRRIQDPFPLPVRWRPAPEELTDHWANICRASAGESAKALELTGRLDQVVEVYRRVPSGRLVVLGRAGSGKTILAVRFVLDLLKTRDSAGAVPVVFGLGSWNPATTVFRDWLIGQLVRDYPGLAATGRDGSTLAAALVEADRILPVLDGFDEIADGLHRAALEALNATTLPLLLTSRPTEYAAAVTGTDVLTAAAGVELTDLTVPDLVHYLPRTTRRAASTGTTVWDPVLGELRNQPEGPAGGTLATVLTTPLMVGLARAIYSDTPGREPAELLDTDRFGTPEAVEEHLLGSFIPTVYRYQPEPRRWETDRVHRWLGYLARHLDRLGTRDLAWWQLGTSMSRASRMLVLALVLGLIFGLMSGLVFALTSGPAAAIMNGLTTGLVAGLVFGVIYGVVSTVAAREPARVRVQILGSRRRAHARFGPGLRTGFLVGLTFGLLFWLANGLVHGLAYGRWHAPVDGLRMGLMSALMVGLVVGLVARLEAPIDTRSVVRPADLLHTNRTAVLFQLIVWVVVWVGLGALMVGLLFGATDGLVFGLVGGIGGGLGYALSSTAWGQWMVLARIWLPLTGRLPWAVVAFLDDACARGVLRQAGAVYHFRHARLQDHLTRRPSPQAGGRRT